MIEEQGQSESCLRIRASSITTNKPKLIIRFARSNQLGFSFFSPLMPAVRATFPRPARYILTGQRKIIDNPTCCVTIRILTYSNNIILSWTDHILSLHLVFKDYKHCTI